ncbi:TrkH family potassium uptake protein [Myceligenerans pegani]|uniref:TrkH family potassium uptake protein n=1 Tax=Myceligenerans pegani TaxID=2776917 RepID=A0ABR9N4N9_9MICO|nr:potassium transporter TrkG [Myceligenerans sp. TRM 65318]MBE1878637.1 TrkH family potassium uptake protein [Myceligenerans sp. TRM 65318]MBE3020908.1 TrkH family potassium uptake protein [Myceligenerans sp. TRM 65318]
MRWLRARLYALREMVDEIARHSPARLAIVVFAAVIAVFTALLLAPWATASGTSARFVDALFTAVSAVCITGLVVQDTATYWSLYGQIVILTGIKVGGLGIMTIASIIGMVISRRIGLTQRLLTASETKTSKLGEVGSLVRTVIVTATALELAIAVLLFPRFVVIEGNVGSAAWHALFYGISAFNNAGFIPTREGLLPHVGDWGLVLPVALGVFIGSLGFPVILNVYRALREGWGRGLRRRWGLRLTLHSKLTLTTSLALLLIGSVVIGVLEWNNPDTFGPLDWPSKLLAALFAGVMPRSGGFNTVDIGAMGESTWLVTDALMFVGGGAASTAGGIKVTTLAVILLAIVAEARGDRDIDAYGRRIPSDILRLALGVTFFGATAVLLSCVMLLQFTDHTLSRVLFESLSAYATVGLSTGVTGDLPDVAKYILSTLMFVGRTGGITFAAALALRDRRRIVRFPEERPIIG